MLHLMLLLQIVIKILSMKAWLKTFRMRKLVFDILYRVADLCALRLDKDKEEMNASESLPEQVRADKHCWVT